MYANTNEPVDVCVINGGCDGYSVGIAVRSDEEGGETR